jgi:capsular polysaccharide biosynthesis protein
MTFTYSTTSMSVSTSKGNVIYVTVTSLSETETLAIMNATTNIFIDYIKDNYNMAEDDSIMFSLANDVDEPEDDVVSNTLLFTAIGGVGCMAVCVLIMALIVTIDQRVKSEYELAERYGITVLGSIPDFEDKNLEKGGYYHGYKYEE